MRIKDQFLRKIIGNNDNTSLETAVLTWWYCGRMLWSLSISSLSIVFTQNLLSLEIKNLAPLRPGEGMTKGGLWKEAWKIQIKQNCFTNLKLVSAYLYVFCHRKPRLETKVNYLRHNGCHQYQNVPEAVWRLKDSILWTWNGLENFLCKEICETWIKTYLVFHKTIQRKRVLEFEEGWLRQIINSYKD